MPTSGPLRLRVAAEALGVSVRTFQRRLLAAGVSLTTLVRTSRLDLAEHLLVETNAKVVDIALDLGYSDHAHFTRAFRGWTGLAPCAYRRHVDHDRLSARPDAARATRVAVAGRASERDRARDFAAKDSGSMSRSMPSL
jgi:AraC-like DNA-binding protein